MKKAFLLANVVFVFALAGLFWFGLQAFHELGHVLAAWATGGHVRQVVLHPLTVSRTDVLPNPRPLVVLWAGPLLGAVLPTVLWGLWRVVRAPAEDLVRLFAAVCWVAAGAYVCGGAVAWAGDAGDLLRLGCSRWTLLAVGAVQTAVGLALWHTLGTGFGLADRWNGSWSQSLGALTALLAVVAVLLAVNARSGPEADPAQRPPAPASSSQAAQEHTD